MAITFNFELHPTANKRGKYTIYLRLTEGRQSKRIKTTIELSSKKDWNKEKQQVRSSERNYEIWNEALDKEREAAKQLYRTLKAEGVATSTQVINNLKRTGANTTLLAYAKKVTDDKYQAGKMGTWKKYGSFISKLEGFLKDYVKVEDVSFSEVTPDFIKDFTAYLKSLPNQRDESTRLHTNTIGKMQKIFRAILNDAEASSLIKPDKNPFNSKTITIESEDTTKDKYTLEELAKLEALKLKEGSLIWHARNLFFFSLYCAGIRLADVMQLRWGNIKDGRLSYRMRKNSKGKDVLLVPQAQAILDCYRTGEEKPTDYIFPYLSSSAKYAKAKYVDGKLEEVAIPLALEKELFDTINSKEVGLNKQLKKLAALAKIDKPISFHMARHSFAQAAKKAGIDVATLKDLLNHSSLSVTQRYLDSLDTTQQDAAMMEIFNVKKQKEEALLAELKGLTADQLQALLAKL